MGLRQHISLSYTRPVNAFRFCCFKSTKFMRSRELIEIAPQVQFLPLTIYDAKIPTEQTPKIQSVSGCRAIAGVND